MSLTNTQYDNIMRTYQDRQLERQHLITARKNEVFQKSPECAAIDGAIAHLSVQKARQLLSGDETALQNIHAEIQAFAHQRKEILMSLGYPEDYFEPAYVCPDCQDTGYIQNQRCHCLKQASIDLVYEQSNLANILFHENFEHFSFSYYADDIYDPVSHISALSAAQNAYSKCKLFVENFDNKFENILLLGDPGVGKTFLSNCVAKELLDTGHSVVYFSAQQFFQVLADSTFRKGDGSSMDYQNILDCDLLIIDDLGTEMMNSFTTSQFFVCMNERILRQKSTLISSNLDLSGIANIYSERVYSRIVSNYMLLHLFGKDIRVQKSLKGN